MSSIEQAAKRLEELRRSGISMPGEVDDRGVRPAMPSTPEGVVRAMEALGKSPDYAGHVRNGLHEPSARVPSSGRGGHDREAVHAASRHVELDFRRLAEKGYLTPDAKSSRLSDEFRVIKRPIIRNALAKDGARVRHGNLVMITSALPGEGKTFTAVNLAMSIAGELDSTVLLVDGDVANPTVPKLLGAPEAPGLLDLLTDREMDFSEALIKTNVERLSLIPAGTKQPHSTELLASDQMAQMLEEVSSRYSDRIVVFDTPPLLATTEARALAPHMGQIVMVVSAESTTQSAVAQALTTVESCPVVMLVLNKTSRSELGSYYGYPGTKVR
jgi:exopolysaccharide/PEP-CTERM locus tyrosine autokinase